MKILMIIAVSCLICEGKFLIPKLQRTFEPLLGGLQGFAKHVSKGKLEAAIKNVTDGMVETFSRGKEALLVAPGTNWCGAGNAARHFDDLGLKFEADQCCREHDNCFDNIGGKETKYGVVNDNPYTMSHCDCEKKFFHCLKDANTIGSVTIGFTYFNVLRPKCFEFDYPIIKCLKFGNGFPKKQDCQEYKLDFSKPKQWLKKDAFDWNRLL